MILSDDHLSELLLACDINESKDTPPKRITLVKGEIVCTTEEIRSLVQELRRLRDKHGGCN